ncbi:hypothetical protein J5N97_026381 [Dioscorea zingiberensis]|uniref:CCHC-type domain-containing protein n=1 Tax=Dioscorea zingiberensis TaxID=325984 RepID=A0A9D5C2T9_9LILI|nr:hypothetical protein J5N97_026381 [Dioscorea zingiberensis]
MNGASLFIKDELKINDTLVEILMGILNLYSLVGSVAASYTSGWIGHSYKLVFAASIFFTGALLMGFATNYSFLMVGCFIAGIGIGYALMIAPVYTTEISPTSSCGFLASFPEVFINFSILPKEGLWGLGLVLKLVGKGISRGHRARACRNSVTCFRCRGVGHKSFDCKRRNERGNGQKRTEIWRPGAGGKAEHHPIVEEGRGADPGSKGSWEGVLYGRKKTMSKPDEVEVNVPELDRREKEFLKQMVRVEVVDSDRVISAKDIRAYLTRTWGAWSGKIVCSVKGCFLLECPSMTWRAAVVKWGVVDVEGVKVKFGTWEEDDSEVSETGGRKMTLINVHVPLLADGGMAYKKVLEGWWWVVRGKRIWVSCEVAQEAENGGNDEGRLGVGILQRQTQCRHLASTSSDARKSKSTWRRVLPALPVFTGGSLGDGHVVEEEAPRSQTPEKRVGPHLEEYVEKVGRVDGGKLLSDHHSEHGDKGTWHPKRAHTVVNKKMKEVITNTNAANEEIKKGTFQAIPEYSDLELLINEEDENVGDYLDERPENAIELELARMWKTQLSGGEGIQANAPKDTPSGKETGGNIPTTPVVVSLDLDPLDINEPKRQEVNFENLLLTSEQQIIFKSIEK